MQRLAFTRNPIQSLALAGELYVDETCKTQMAQGAILDDDGEGIAFAGAKMNPQEIGKTCYTS